MTTNKISVVHLGQDYSTISVGGEEFETSLGLGEAILEAQKKASVAQAKVIENIKEAVEEYDDENIEHDNGYIFAFAESAHGLLEDALIHLTD